MPTVKGKKFPYTKKGKAEAKDYMMTDTGKMPMKKKEMMKRRMMK